MLGDLGLRGHYDARARAPDRKSLPRASAFVARAALASSLAPEAAQLEDAGARPSARPFARRAEELIRAGDLRQAKLQLVMANHFDRDNEVLVAAL